MLLNPEMKAMKVILTCPRLHSAEERETSQLHVDHSQRRSSTLLECSFSEVPTPTNRFHGDPGPVCLCCMSATLTSGIPDHTCIVPHTAMISMNRAHASTSTRKLMI